MSSAAGRMAILSTLLFAAPGNALEVPPGSVVRWVGEGVTRCGEGGGRWTALDGVCYFPIDLLKSPGPVELRRERAGSWETVTVRVSDYPYPVQEITLQDETRVHLSSDDLARVQRENAAIGRLWSLTGPRRFRLPLGSPLADRPEGGRFGSRRIFNGEPRSPHSGADYAAQKGTPVLAVADGEVVLADEHFFAGNSVFVHHGDGLISMYFHLDRIDVKEGDQVERGQPVGLVGSTGRATGPHLHVGIRWRGRRVDPELLFGDPQALPEPAASAR